MGAARAAAAAAARGAGPALLRGPVRRRDRHDPELYAGDRPLAGGSCAGHLAHGGTTPGPGGIAMTDHEVEDFVRDTFRDHEHLVGDAATRLLPSVRTRRQRRTTTRSAAVALAAVAVLGGTVVAANALSPPGRTPEPSASATQGTVPAGWRVE